VSTAYRIVVSTSDGSKASIDIEVSALGGIIGSSTWKATPATTFSVADGNVSGNSIFGLGAVPVAKFDGFPESENGSGQNYDGGGDLPHGALLWRKV
jgi:hypothetical protein